MARNGKLNAWIKAIRPKTLPAALAPILVGNSLAFVQVKFNVTLGILCFVCTLFLQMNVNVANDYYDFIHGYDTKKRIGPPRAAALGLLSLRELRVGMFVLAFCSTASGMFLIARGGTPLLIAGTFALISVFAYSTGPIPFASNALGDLVVFLFFGFVAVCGSYYVQVLDMNWIVALCALPPGALITCVLVVNNHRDREEDQANGKNTMAVIFGIKGTRIEYISLMILAYLIPVILTLIGRYSYFIMLPLLSSPVAVSLVHQVMGSAQGKALNKTLALNAALAMVYCALFAAGLVIGRPSI